MNNLAEGQQVAVLDFIRNEWRYAQEPSNSLNTLFEDRAYTSKS